MGVREKTRRAHLLAPTPDPEDSLEELSELTQSAGARVEGKILQNRERLDPATLVGRGKLEEIRQQAVARELDLLIFDFDLTPTQQRKY